MTKEKSHKLELIAWEDRPHCIYLNDYRIAGSKPWGGGKSIRSWMVSEKDILEAISRIAKETREPNAAQSQSPKAIRAEAITDCVRVISDFVARKNIDGLTQELITAIRSLGDRG